MTTTSAADLLAHASLLTRQLRDSAAPITGPQWATFDVTVHRLMLELIGGGALHTQGRTNRPSPPALAVFRSYPEPLRYPVDTQLSAKEAAVLASRRPEYFRRKIQHGNLHAVRDGGAYLINTRDLDQNPDIAPADLSDPHPLARVSCVLGAMADLVVAEREADPGRLMDDAQMAGTYIHILSLAHTAARHALTHGLVGDAGRPLAIAQYAERAIDALKVTGERPLALVRMTSTSPEPFPATVNEKLEAAVHHWAKAAEPEIVRLVPSADTMRMLANQGVHLYAVTHQMVAAIRDSSSDVDALDVGLVEGARALEAADRAWDKLTTASRPGHEFISASRELFTALQAVEGLVREPDASWDPERALRDLSRASDTLGRVMDLSGTLPDRLLRSGLVYAPARSLPSTLVRMRAQHQGRYVTIAHDDAPELQARWREAADVARVVQHHLDALAVSAPEMPAPSMGL